MPIIERAVRAYLEVTLSVPAERRPEMVEKVYEPYRQRFLEKVPGAISKNLLLRDEDVQILHGFDTLENAQTYRDGELFRAVGDLLAGYRDRDPVVALYHVHD